MAERLIINNQAAQHVQAYLDYNSLVGDYDNDGKMMSEQEYEQFKKNMIEKNKTRVFISWINERGTECKMIGPATKCFCGHRFKDHNYLDPKNKQVKCKDPKCNCKCYDYVPAYGSYDFKCLCKHSYQIHDPNTKKCGHQKCTCGQFSSTWSCSCGSKYNDHRTIIETREERIRSGKPVSDMMRLNDELNVPTGNGGLMNFAQLADGADRYEAYIDKLGGQNVLGAPQKQNELGYIQPKKVDDPNIKKKNSKLSQLNQKLANQEIDEMNLMGGQEDSLAKEIKKKGMGQIKESQQIKQNQNFSDRNQEFDSLDLIQQQKIPQEQTAFYLYNTPHQFVRVKMVGMGKR